VGVGEQRCKQVCVKQKPNTGFHGFHGFPVGMGQFNLVIVGMNAVRDFAAIDLDLTRSITAIAPQCAGPH